MADISVFSSGLGGTHGCGKAFHNHGKNESSAGRVVLVLSLNFKELLSGISI
jgi:hypothetical protein